MEEKNRFYAKGSELLDKIEELIKEGNVRRITILNPKGEVLLDIPLSIGVIGAVFAPWATLIGFIAGTAAGFAVEYYKKNNNTDE